MSRDPQITVGVGNAPFPANASERMADLIRSALPPVADPVPRSCCGHNPHPGRACGKTIAGMGGHVCPCKGAK